MGGYGLELFDLAKEHSATIVPFQLGCIQKAVEQVEQRLNENDLHCLIINADITTKLRFSNIIRTDMMETYRPNVIESWKVTEIFLPLLEEYALHLQQRSIKQSSSTIYTNIKPGDSSIVQVFECLNGELEYEQDVPGEMIEQSEFITSESTVGQVRIFKNVRVKLWFECPTILDLNFMYKKKLHQLQAELCQHGLYYEAIFPFSTNPDGFDTYLSMIIIRPVVRTNLSFIQFIQADKTDLYSMNYISVCAKTFSLTYPIPFLDFCPKATSMDITNEPCFK
ncbi:unnamed protein product [Adineta steineri]|uniref:Uncharacterized protein n=1 Tax=Adineta steineri TaxID=433720 RepID=A0A818PG85_9BILA|nr:unnamed protein product [Adineta steineri]